MASRTARDGHEAEGEDDRVFPVAPCGPEPVGNENPRDRDGDEGMVDPEEAEPGIRGAHVERGGEKGAGAEGGAPEIEDGLRDPVTRRHGMGADEVGEIAEVERERLGPGKTLGKNPVAIAQDPRHEATCGDSHPKGRRRGFLGADAVRDEHGENHGDRTNHQRGQVQGRSLGKGVHAGRPSVKLAFAVGSRRDAAVLLEHAAEIIPVRKSAVLRDLLDRLVGVAQEMAGPVEPVRRRGRRLRR